jgi:hypothetical protein
MPTAAVVTVDPVDFPPTSILLSAAVLGKPPPGVGRAVCPSAATLLLSALGGRSIRRPRRR